MANYQGLNKAATVIPFTDQDTHAIAWQQHVRGGWHTGYATLAERDAIFLDRREWGMIVVLNDGSKYELVKGTSSDLMDNANWQPYAGAGNGTVVSGKAFDYELFVDFVRDANNQKIPYTFTKDVVYYDTYMFLFYRCLQTFTTTVQYPQAGPYFELLDVASTDTTDALSARIDALNTNGSLTDNRRPFFASSLFNSVYTGVHTVHQAAAAIGQHGWIRIQSTIDSTAVITMQPGQTILGNEFFFRLAGFNLNIGQQNIIKDLKIENGGAAAVVRSTYGADNRQTPILRGCTLFSAVRVEAGCFLRVIDCIINNATGWNTGDGTVILEGSTRTFSGAFSVGPGFATIVDLRGQKDVASKTYVDLGDAALDARIDALEAGGGGSGPEPVWIFVGDRSRNNISYGPLDASVSIADDQVFANSFGLYSANINLNYSAYSNDFVYSNTNITLDTGCSTNVFERYANTITLAENCTDNRFGESCYAVELDANCKEITIGKECTEITIGTGCERVQVYSSSNLIVPPATTDVVYRNNVIVPAETTVDKIYVDDADAALQTQISSLIATGGQPPIVVVDDTGGVAGYDNYQQMVAANNYRFGVIKLHDTLDALGLTLQINRLEGNNNLASGSDLGANALHLIANEVKNTDLGNVRLEVGRLFDCRIAGLVIPPGAEVRFLSCTIANLQFSTIDGTLIVDSGTVIEHGAGGIVFQGSGQIIYDNSTTTNAVTSVNNRIGAVTLTRADVQLSNVDNTSDAAKPISAATQAALDAKAAASHGHTLGNGTTAGFSDNNYTSAEKSKLAGITTNSSDSYLLNRTNHTGTQSADTITDGTTNKAYTATEKTKLAGIATGATANSTNAVLLARANHTGTQSADTVVDGTTNKVYTATEKTKLAGLSNYTLPVATSTTVGGVKAGTGVAIAADGTISATGGGSTSTASTYQALVDGAVSYSDVVLTSNQVFSSVAQVNGTTWSAQVINGSTYAAIGTAKTTAAAVNTDLSTAFSGGATLVILRVQPARTNTAQPGYLLFKLT